MSAAHDRRVLRYEIPVDDEWHWIELNSDPLHVASRRPEVVEFWSIDTGGPRIRRGFTVFGTGQTGVEGRYVGTAIAADGALVWHLFEATPWTWADASPEAEAAS